MKIGDVVVGDVVMWGYRFCNYGIVIRRDVSSTNNKKIKLTVFTFTYDKNLEWSWLDADHQCAIYGIRVLSET